jgi:hypothetical protein
MALKAVKYIINYAGDDRCIDDTEESNPTVWEKEFFDFDEMCDYVDALYLGRPSDFYGYNRLEVITIFSNGLSCRDRACLFRDD